MEDKRLDTSTSRAEDTANGGRSNMERETKKMMGGMCERRNEGGKMKSSRMP